jgi:hypothetical protein
MKASLETDQGAYGKGARHSADNDEIIVATGGDPLDPFLKSQDPASLLLLYFNIKVGCKVIVATFLCCHIAIPRTADAGWRSQKRPRIWHRSRRMSAFCP